MKMRKMKASAHVSSCFSLKKHQRRRQLKTTTQLQTVKYHSVLNTRCDRRTESFQLTSQPFCDNSEGERDWP